MMLRALAQVADYALNRAVPLRAEVRRNIESSAPGLRSPVVADRPGPVSADGVRAPFVGPGHSTSTAARAVETARPCAPRPGPRHPLSVSAGFPGAEPDRLVSELFYEAAGALLCCAHRAHVPLLVAELRDRGGEFEALGY